MEETSFFEHGLVKVTNARFIVGAQTYAMHGVTSVKSHIVEPSRRGPIIAIVIGLFILLIGTMTAIVIGLMLIGGGILVLINQRPTYVVLLNSASGEVQALSSEDDDYIGGVVDALNEALIHRG